MLLDYLSIKGDPTVCTSAVIFKDGKILIGLRHYTEDKWKKVSVWTTPGGRCEQDETLETNLRRETVEETGIRDLVIRKYLGKVPGAKKGDTLHIFRCITGEDPKLMEPEKFEEWRWVRLQEIPENFINPSIFQLI